MFIRVSIVRNLYVALPVYFHFFKSTTLFVYWACPVYLAGKSKSSSVWMAGGVESRVSLLYYYISLASVPSAFAAMQCLFFLVSLFGAS